MDIRSFKLTTGEELVAQLLQETSRGFLVKSPLIVHMMRTPEGPTLAFAQWSLVQKQGVEVELLTSALVSAPVQLLDEVSDSYLQQTTGIALPPKGGSQILLS